MDPLHDLRGERAIAVEIMIDRDPKILRPESRARFGLKMTHEIGHPGHLSLIVEVSVAYEYVMTVIGYVRHPLSSLTRDLRDRI